MSIVVGLHAAAARAGLPRTSLRRLVAKGDVTASKDSDGTWTFDGDELDQVREARMRGALAGTSTTSSPTSSVVSATSPPLAAMGALPPWMAAAVNAREETSESGALSGDPDADADVTQALEPYLGIPLGASRSASPMSAWPYSAIESPTSSVSPRVAALEQQLVHLTAQRDHWYRTARIKEIADTIASEAMTASGDVNAAHVAGHAAAQALGSMPSEQLSNDALALSLARNAGHNAASAWVQAQQAPWPLARDEVARMRERRRSRSPR